MTSSLLVQEVMAGEENIKVNTYYHTTTTKN
jgi:hypothetical protein